MLILTTADGTPYRDTDNLPIILKNDADADPELSEASLDLNEDEARFIMRNAIEAVYGRRYMPVWMLH